MKHVRRLLHWPFHWPFRWPRSVRGRLTTLVVAAATLVFVPASVAGAVWVRHIYSDYAWRHTRRTAAIVVSTVRRDAPLPPVSRNDVVQVVAPNRQIIAASPVARGLPPLTTAVPAPHQRQLDVRTCTNARVGCLRVAAQRVSSSTDSPVVYVGRRTPGVFAGGTFDIFFAAQAGALIALSGWGGWKVTGRALRPVQAMTTTLAEINVNDLTDRVPEPGTADEIGKLAQTINTTLGRVERSLEQQQRFTADASHELRTPIAGLRTQLEEAQLYPDDTDVPELIDHALSDLDRLQAIVTDMLLLARLEAGTAGAPEPLDLGELTRRHLSQRQGNHQVEPSLEPAVMINAGPGLIDRALGNLLDNADRHAHDIVRIEVGRNADTAELAVSDDGAGIPPADRQRVFQRFTRLDSARSRDSGGTGLGLAITSNIAHAYGGTLHVEDSPLGGARFVLRLPLIPPSTERPD